MSDAKRERQKKSKAKRQDLKIRTNLADRRRKGLKNDEEEADLASYPRRFFAYCIDQVIFFFFNFFYLSIASVYLKSFATSVISGFFPLYIFGMVYLVPKIANKGKTFGCKKAKIMIISEDGTSFLGFSRSFARWFISQGAPALVAIVLSLLLPDQKYFLLIAFVYLVSIAAVQLPMFFNDNRQGFHDKIARSVVIRELKAAK
ncbi:MAG: RDD family protein [Acidimicrobiia bacterium]